MMLVKAFAALLAVAVLATSVWMNVLGARFQAVEARAVLVPLFVLLAFYA